MSASLPATTRTAPKHTQWIYNQSHWPGGSTPFWDNPGDSRFIFVTIRQESTYYDDAYSVNSANLGPWGDAITDELVPEIDRRFHTIAAPYGRLQEGGSTGGWTSLASTLFRPDVYGATWSYYPDSLDFHRHQAVDLYEEANAYRDATGTPVGSWRDGDRVTVTMEQEDHYEVALGTNSRSFDQWDVWNAVFSPQGYNGYPLDPWDKVDGTIDHDTTTMWEKQFDLTAYLRNNWNGSRNLGQALEGRIHVSVGTLDNYYLDGGVQYFKKTVEELGGTTWAEIQIEPGRTHEGYYDYLPLQEQLDRMWTWVNNHAPTGSDPLTAQDTAAATRGNDFDEVLAWGGREAAVKRQARPTVYATSVNIGDTLTATFGAWDPGMTLVGQWTRDSQAFGNAIDLGTPSRDRVEKARATFTVTDAEVGTNLAFTVTGAKRGYVTETRVTSSVPIAAAPSPSPTLTPGASPTAGTSAAPTVPSTPIPTTASTAHATKPLANTGTDPVGLPVTIAAIVLVATGLMIARARTRRQSRR